MNNLTLQHTIVLAVEPPSPRLPRSLKLGLFGGGVLLLLCSYGLTMLTHIAGSNDPFLEDGGEIQVALNIWGTLHGTGYPLFTILGNIAVGIARAFGINAVAAPSLYSFAWGVVALGLVGVLLRKITGQTVLAAISTLLIALTRGVWAYNVLPKTYSMSLAFFVAILAVALWPSNRISAQKRFWLLTAIGGFGVAHHRLIAFALPGALIAVLPLLWAESVYQKRWRRLIITFSVAIPLALIGFLPYLYLPARSLAHGVWVYGDPGTLTGFWREFTAQESNNLFAFPPDMAAWLDDTRATLQIFVEQLSPIGVLVVPLLAAYAAKRRYEARIALLCALPVLIFVLVWHRAVVAQAVVMPVVVFAVFATAVGVSEITTRITVRGKVRHFVYFATIAMLAPLGLIWWSFGALRAIVIANEGDQEVALARTVPRDHGTSVFMLPWGMRYSAVAFSHYVTGENADLPIVDHNADLVTLIASGHTLYTDKDTFYTFPLNWWNSRLGHVSLNAVLSAQDVVQIDNKPLISPEANAPAFSPIRLTDNLQITGLNLRCNDQTMTLSLYWYAQDQPVEDYHVFVHLIGLTADKVLATADESAPVYGWYPTNRWLAGEHVIDRYTLPLLPDGLAVQFGLYQELTPGKFVNYGVNTIALQTVESCVDK